MSETLSIELRCNKNTGGSYNAHTYVNGKKNSDAELFVNRGDCDAIALLYGRVKKAYPGTEIRVKGLDKMCYDKIMR